MDPAGVRWQAARDSFVLDSNGKPFGKVTATRTSMATVSGIEGYTFMKSTGSGWTNYVMDQVTTIPETRDRMAATAMDASWVVVGAPKDYAAANAKILDPMIEVFATTYSESVQDSLYRMGETALAEVPEISEISMACPNAHLLMNLTPFGLDNNNQKFLPTDGRTARSSAPSAGLRRGNHRHPAARPSLPPAPTSPPRRHSLASSHDEGGSARPTWPAERRRYLHGPRPTSLGVTYSICPPPCG